MNRLSPERLEELRAGAPMQPGELGELVSGYAQALKLRATVDELGRMVDRLEATVKEHSEVIASLNCVSHS